MSTPAAPSPSSIRTRRLFSVILSSGTVLVAAIVLLTYITRNATFLSDGTRGLGQLQALAVDSLGLLPFTALGALLLVTTAPAHDRVDRMPRRLPLGMSLTALCLVGACFVFPAALTAFSLLFGFASIGFF